MIKLNKTVSVTILTSVVTSVILDTRSGSESNSIANIVVVAALGIDATIRITPAIIGSTSTKARNPIAINGEINMRTTTADEITCQLNFKDVMDANCIPKLTIIIGTAAAPNIDNIDKTDSGTCHENP